MTRLSRMDWASVESSRKSTPLCARARLARIGVGCAYRNPRKILGSGAAQFVDEVGKSFAQLREDNQNLKKQIEALKSAPPVPARAPAPVAPAPLRGRIGVGCA
jgi:hypothetical protein